MDVSIIIPIYNPDKQILNKTLAFLKNQRFNGKIEKILMREKGGLAKQLNIGILKAKHPIVITLHQDCIPQGRDWLSKLVRPFSDKDVVASVSDVELPESFWKSFDFIAKILSAKEQKITTPGLDEKGCAYRKSVLLEIGLFNDKTYRTAGEDYDMYLRLMEVGKIAYPHVKLLHLHYYNWKKRLKKEYQLSNGFGALLRNYGSQLPRWFIGILKSIPILGFPLFLYSLRIKKLGSLIIPAIPLFLLVNFIYSYGFWKGFLTGRQTV